jgi:peptide/nickel transport system ATP-binding protein
VLSVSGLTTSFMLERQWVPVVRNVSFEIAPRETVAIVDESGSGKSVTALSIMRLISKEIGRIEGRVNLAGRDLLALPETAMKDIRGNDVAVIFQEPMTSLNPVLTIGFQIAEALIQHRGLSRAAAEAETIRLLDRVRIPAAQSRFHEHPHRFSGGMRQRVMIAMALACKPKLLIADEPTTALDVSIQAQILELLKELQQEEGMSILFITHDTTRSEARCARRTTSRRCGIIAKSARPRRAGLGRGVVGLTASFMRPPEIVTGWSERNRGV